MSVVYVTESASNQAVSEAVQRYEECLLFMLQSQQSTKQYQKLYRGIKNVCCLCYRVSNQPSSIRSCTEV